MKLTYLYDASLTTLAIQQKKNQYPKFHQKQPNKVCPNISKTMFQVNASEDRVILLSLKANDNIDNNNKHQATKFNHGLRRVFPYLEHL